jgi:acyl carrier protein
MSGVTKDEVRAFLTDHVKHQLEAQGRQATDDQIPDDCDLFLSGMIDSLGLLELAGALSDYCGFELEFEELDPEQMTIVGALCDFVVEQAAKQPS